MQFCCVCREETPKYRCPACRVRYCSLVCYKKHKDTCVPFKQQAPTIPNELESTAGFSSEEWCCEDLLDEDDLTDKVSVEKLQLLDQSKELRDVLCNPHLRQLLRSIDSADNKYNAMKSAMQEPLFVEFSDRCLKIIENENLTTHESEDDC